MSGLVIGGLAAVLETGALTGVEVAVGLAAATGAGSLAPVGGAVVLPDTMGSCSVSRSSSSWPAWTDNTPSNIGMEAYSAQHTEHSAVLAA